MKLGAFSPEIQLDGVNAVFAEAQRLGFTQMQYDFVTSHGEEMPEAFSPNELESVATAARTHGIDIVAVNGTFNMADPDPAKRGKYTRRFERIAEACTFLRCRIITICTGSRHPSSMWAWHEETASEEAWADLIATTRAILPYAERHGLFLGVETEASNVCNTIERTRRYLDEIGSPWLKVIMDCANLFPAGTARQENVRPTIQKAFDLLGEDLVLAHAKDIMESEKVLFAAPGAGIVDYEFYFRMLKEYRYSGGLILHGIHGVDEFPASIERMKQKLNESCL